MNTAIIFFYLHTIIKVTKYFTLDLVDIYIWLYY